MFKMEVIVLGSGTAAPSLNRNMSGYLLKISDKKILFDSGPGTIRQLLRLKINLLDINDIFYTHLHNDHINDLPAVIWSNNYGLLRSWPLNFYGPRGFLKYYNTLMTKILKPSKLKYSINVKEMLNNSIMKITLKNKIQSLKNKNNKDPNKNNIIIRSIKSKHTDSSVSYRIDYNNKSIVYSGDTEYSEEIIKISKNADILILECSYLEKRKGHLTPSLCGKIATKANVKKLVLTHFNPECDKMDVKNLCKKEYKGNIVLAKDLLTLRL